jgi:hypothetical protein
MPLTGPMSPIPAWSFRMEAQQAESGIDWTAKHGSNVLDGTNTRIRFGFAHCAEFLIDVPTCFLSPNGLQPSGSSDVVVSFKRLHRSRNQQPLERRGARADSSRPRSSAHQPPPAFDRKSYFSWSFSAKNRPSRGSTCLDGSPNTAAVPADSPNAIAVGGTSINYGAGSTMAVKPGGTARIIRRGRAKVASASAGFFLSPAIKMVLVSRCGRFPMSSPSPTLRMDRFCVNRAPVDVRRAYCMEAPVWQPPNGPP